MTTLLIIIITISILVGILIDSWFRRWDKTDGYWDGWFEHDRWIRGEYWRYKNIYTITIVTPKLITMANRKTMTEEEQKEYEFYLKG